MSIREIGWTRPEDVPSRPATKAPLLAGAALAVLFFLGFGSWAALAPLASATLAEGTIRVETHRKTVQHLEGGIVREILVREGDMVTAGQVLLRLDATQSGTAVALLRDQRDALLALEARLVAERDGLEDIPFPAELSKSAEFKTVALLEGQRNIFQARRHSLQAQAAILSQRAEQLGTEIRANKAQLVATEEQIRLIAEEIATVSDLLSRGLERKPRLLALQRQKSTLEGMRGEQTAAIVKAEQAITETGLQAADLKTKRSAEVALELRETQSQLLEIGERLGLADNIAERTDVLAPVPGRVVNLTVHTPGGVIRPGESILDIVPQSDELVVEARIRPVDVDTVAVGQKAQVSLTAYKQRTTPRLDGRLVNLSADALTDADRRITYYEAEIKIDAAERAKLSAVKLYPGMPAEVMIVTGERTLLDYLLQPLFDSFRRALRET
jgi:HlyD family type I secretion membrane fusion protein